MASDLDGDGAPEIITNRRVPGSHYRIDVWRPEGEELRLVSTQVLDGST